MTHTAALPLKPDFNEGLGLMAWTKNKMAVGVGAGLLVAAGIITAIFFRHEIQNRIHLANGRRSIANHSAKLFDMTPYYNCPASYFDKINEFPAWRAVPRGFQTFANVPLQIDGMKCLWGGINAKDGLVFPENLLGIVVNQKFEALYVYHAAFCESRRKTPVYELVFNYEDGSSVTNQVRYGDDILDWFSRRGQTVRPPTGPNSKLAWHGETVDKQPLRFCLTAMKNPQPSLQVTTIDLYSCKSPSSACILAMTTGRLELMK